MKICLVTDYVPGLHDTWSGAEVICVRLSKLLEEKGESVSFITTGFGKKPAPDNIHPIPTPLVRIESLRKLFYFDAVSFYSCLTTLRKMKPDVIHLHCHILFLPVLLSAMILKIPVVMTAVDHWNICPNGMLLKPDGSMCTVYHGTQCAGCFPDKYPLQVRKVLAGARTRTSNWSMRKLNKIVALTSSSKTMLEQCGLPSNKIPVVYYQLSSMDEIMDCPHFDEPTIFFSGWLRKYKGLHVIVEAMAHVVSQVPEAKLLVLSPGEDVEYGNEVREAIERHKLTRHISFLGARPNKEAMQLLSRSHAVVVPEQWPSAFGPVILMEALGLGQAVVASRVGSIPEFIEDGVSGFLADHDQPAQFADRIIWLLKHPEQAQAVGKEAQSRMRRIYSQDIGQEAISLYEDTIKKRPGG